MDAILEMRAITKTFPGVTALDAVSLSVARGEIHALVGENGAGKSTLMKVLSGVYRHGEYEGEILFDGTPLQARGIAETEAKGIIIIHQELALVPHLSIAENVFLGNEIARRGVIDWPETLSRTQELLRRVGLKEPPTIQVGRLGVGKQQLVEIAKALSKQVKLLILDEPTAALQETDSETLLDLLLELKARGVSAILISHKLNEVRRVADRITVLRDGAAVSTMDAAAGEVSEERIIRDMVGRDMAHRYPERDATIGEVLLEVEGWSASRPDAPERRVLHDIDLTVRAGEVVGIAGLMGSGRTELAMSVFGHSYGSRIEGKVRLKGQEIDTSTVAKAVASGLAYVTEDRKALGLILEDSIQRNTPLANLSAIATRGVIEPTEERSVAERFREALGIRTPHVAQKAVNLSGGNQQKVVLAKWLFADPQVLILDEPTRGIDVGAKFEIYTIINQLAEQGRGVLLISSEMPELLGLCDRIYVMREGRFVGALPRARASQEAIMAMIVRA